MPSCSRWFLKVVFVTVIYVISAYTLYEVVSRLDLFTRPGIEVVAYVILYNTMILVVSIASIVVIFYMTGSFIATSSFPLLLLLLVLGSPYRWILLPSLLITLALLGLLIFLESIRGRLTEPLFDFLVKPRLSPTALAASALILYTSWNLIGLRTSCELELIYVTSSLIAALIASISSNRIYESLIVGALAGLGPLGLIITASYASFKPLKLGVCSGVEVGELQGFMWSASRSRALLDVIGEPRGNLMVCSQPSKAVLEVKEPWILWVYGLESRSIAESIALNLGGGVILDLETPGPRITELDKAIEEALKQTLGGVVRIGLGSIEPLETRIAITPSIAETLKDTRTLILETIPLQKETLLKLVFELVRKHPRVIVTLPEIPWIGETLAPRGPAKTTAFIVTKLTDPLQASTISKTLLLKQYEKAKEALMKGTLTLAYPGCGSRIIAIKPQIHTIR